MQEIQVQNHDKVIVIFAPVPAHISSDASWDEEESKLEDDEQV